MCKICLKLTIRTQKLHHWLRSGVFIVNFKQIFKVVLLLLLSTLNVIYIWTVALNVIVRLHSMVVANIPVFPKTTSLLQVLKLVSLKITMQDLSKLVYIFWISNLFGEIISEYGSPINFKESFTSCYNNFIGKILYWHNIKKEIIIKHLSISD